MFLLYDNGLLQIALVVAGVLVGLQLNKLYVQVGVRSRILLAQQLCLTLGVTFLLESLLSYLRIPELVLAPSIMIAGSVLTLAVLLVWRMFYSAALWKNLGAKRVLFYGTSASALEASRSLAAHPELGLSTAGYIDNQLPAGTPVNGARVLGSAADLARVVSEVRPDRIVIGVAERSQRHTISRTAGSCSFAELKSSAWAELYEAACERVCMAELLPSQLIFSDELGARRGAIALQAIYSNIVALAGLALLAVLLLPIAAAIKLSSPGPVIDGHSRWGLNMIPFDTLSLPLPARRRPVDPGGRLVAPLAPGRAAAITERDSRRDVAGRTAPHRPEFIPLLMETDALLRAAACGAAGHHGLEPAQLRLWAQAARST